jgi:ABC-2 type transport system ATP-binding protein
MLQRLGIAQALMNRPQLVFLDEPTDGVDPVGRREIRDLIEELRAEGVAVFLNSHLLSEVERVCNRVAILKDGVLVREGTVEALTTTGRTWQLRSTPIPPETAIALADVLTASDIPNAPSEDATLIRSTLTADDRSTLNAALDTLRVAGVEIEAVEPQRQSLEDLFVSVVTETG